MTTKNTSLVSNYEADTMNAVQELKGRVRIAQGSVELATTDLDANDIVMLAPIPSNASITSIKLAADDLDSGSPALLWNVGLHNTDGTEADLDCYATDITLGQAATAFTEYAFEVRDIADTGQRAWEDAGASVDPHSLYYVSATVDTTPATAVAGTLAFIIEYVVD
jgi:hypothetical protein